ncbi:hypothetical protein HEP84_52460 [Streptomyces sp. RLB1-33]|nr:hypothetical protein [Streptomyces sp. RLB1-33]QIY76230.1 hypothetical protein HEP84_52460 [Streptomyces sp. RLB1-33]
MAGAFGSSGTWALRRELDVDLGLTHLHGQGLGSGGLDRIHDRVRRLEQVRPERGWRPVRLRAGGDVPLRWWANEQVTGLTGLADRPEAAWPLHGLRHEHAASVLVSGL